MNKGNPKRKELTMNGKSNLKGTEITPNRSRVTFLKPSKGRGVSVKLHFTKKNKRNKKTRFFH